MRLGVIAVGKLKDRGLLAGCEEYQKRSRAFLPIERVEVRDEAGAWERATRAGGPIVVLDERGAQIDSPTLASWLSDFRIAGSRHVSFLIGGADGFSDDDRRRADRLLGLSRLTLPHRLAQLLLCEQLYRAGTLLAGHPYHHA